jgi:hypothetical protein
VAAVVESSGTGPVTTDRDGWFAEISVFATEHGYNPLPNLPYGHGAIIKKAFLLKERLPSTQSEQGRM